MFSKPIELYHFSCNDFNVRHLVITGKKTFYTMVKDIGNVTLRLESNHFGPHTLTYYKMYIYSGAQLDIYCHIIWIKTHRVTRRGYINPKLV